MASPSSKSGGIDSPAAKASESVLEFRVIGPGLGLGTLVQGGRSRPPLSDLSKGPASTPLHSSLDAKRIPLLKIQPPGRQTRAIHKTLAAWVSVGAIDLVIVLLSLWVVFTAALLVSAVATPKGLKSSFDDWLSLRPLTLLTGLSPWVAFAGLGLVYFAYLVTFRLIVGRTLGGSLVAREQNQAPHGIAAPEVRRPFSP